MSGGAACRWSADRLRWVGTVGRAAPSARTARHTKPGGQPDRLLLTPGVDALDFDVLDPRSSVPTPGRTLGDAVTAVSF